MAATARAVDLSNVKEGGNFRPRHKAPGDYRAKIVKADDHQPKDKTKPAGWVLTLQVEGDARSTYPYYLSPADNQVWKIGQVCRAAGLNVKNARVRFDPNKLVGKAVGVALDDDEYDGRVKSVIDDVFPVSEVGANADEEPDIDEDEEIVEDEESDIDDVDIPADDDEPEWEEEPEPEPVKPAPKKRVARKPVPEPEPEDDDLDEDEEDTPPPPPRKTTRRKAAPPPPAEDDDDDLDLDDLDDE